MRARPSRPRTAATRADGCTRSSSNMWITGDGVSVDALTADDPRAVGEFRLRARLGTGGMGRVYLGMSPAGRAVAVKLVHPELARDDEVLGRFRGRAGLARAATGFIPVQ